MKSLSKNPIGVFDSGLGGLTVVKALMRQLPEEDVVYFGDTARVPYGTKSREAIIAFSKENVKVLLKYKVKMIVVACNSSSSHAMATLRKNFRLPIVGVIEPGVNKALAVTRNNRVGVIATPATIHSQAYRKLLLEKRSRVKVFDQDCPLFVPLVEAGWFRHRISESVAREYLRQIKRANVDTLILGCTHYPLLKSVLKKVMGTKVTLVDSAREVANEIKELLACFELERGNGHRGWCRFLISDEPQHFRKMAKGFLGYDIRAVQRVT